MNFVYIHRITPHCAYLLFIPTKFVACNLLYFWVNMEVPSLLLCICTQTM